MSEILFNQIISGAFTVEQILKAIQVKEKK